MVKMYPKRLSFEEIWERNVDWRAYSYYFLKNTNLFEGNVAIGTVTVLVNFGKNGRLKTEFLYISEKNSLLTGKAGP